MTGHYIDIVFDKLPDPYNGAVFIEVEDETGASVRVGEWVERPDGTGALRITKMPNAVPLNESWINDPRQPTEEEATEALEAWRQAVEPSQEKINAALREARYQQHYFQLHGHHQGQPHTELCVPDPAHPDRR